MTPEFMEYELRRLPDVVSVAVDRTRVALLVTPTADADEMRLVVAAMLAAAGIDLEVKVLGGIGAAGVAPSRVAPIATGAALGVGVLAAAVAVAALTGALHLGAPAVHHTQSAARPPAAATPLTTVPNFGPSTTLVAGAPQLGSATAGADTAPAATESAATATGSDGSGGAGGAGGAGGSSGGTVGTPGPSAAPSTPQPAPDYVVGAPAVAPPTAWQARADAAGDDSPHWAPVTIVPEATA